MAKRERPPCSVCGRNQAKNAGTLCDRCAREEKFKGAGGRRERRKLSDLKPHPMNAGIYRDEPPEEFAAFIANVKRNGILEDLYVTEDGTIISGERRWRAGTAAGREDAPVIVLDGLDPACDEALEQLITRNVRRTKTNEMIGREADRLWPIFEKRAKERQEVGGVMIPGSEGSTTRDDVGEAIGVAGITAERARAVVRHLDDLEALDDRDSARTLRAELSHSIKGAWELMRSWQRPNMPPSAPDVPGPSAEDDPDDALQPQSKEDGNVALGADGEWPQQPATKETVDDLAGPDTERETTPDQAGLSADPGRHPQDAPAAPKAVRPQYDYYGVPLSAQPGAAEAFDSAARMAELAETFREAGKAMARLARQPGTELLRQRMRPVTTRGEAGLSYRSVDAENAVLALTQTAPAVCRCPECHARGLPANDRSCGVCQGRPYVTAHQLTGIDRRKVQAMKDELGVPGQDAASQEAA